MTSYNPHIDEWIYLIRGNHIEHCREQELLIDNCVIPVLERPDVTVDAERVEKGLSLQKYFPFRLLPWERFQFAMAAGVFLELPGGGRDIYFHVIRDIMGRGSGKNGFIDFLALYFISPLHGIPGYNVDLIANGEDQAATSVRDLGEIIKNPVREEYRKALSSNFSAKAEKVTGKKMGAEFRLNTTSTKNKDSKRTGCVIYDEKHQYTDTRNMNTLKSGLGKVPWWREVTITTDGHVRGGVLDREKRQNERILREYDPQNRTLVNWFRIESEAEWSDINKIVKANPSLADPSFASLRTTVEMEIAGMAETPEYYPEFLAKRCNFPVSDPETAVAQWDDIVACTGEPPFLIRRGMACVGGVDYAKTNDFVGCVLLFRQGDEYAALHHSFICGRSRDLPGIRAPIREWEEAGHCTVIDDVEVPPREVAGWFARHAAEYRVEMVGIDFFCISLLRDAFSRIGMEAFPDRREDKRVYLVRPSDIMRAAPLVNSLFVRRKLHGLDRMMCWYTNNTKAVMDGRGNTHYEKIEPRHRKTDGFMALAHAACCIDSLPDGADFSGVSLGVVTY